MRSRVLSGIHEAIGQTPLVDISRFVRAQNVRGRILAKVEFFSPGLSKKDRIARHIIEQAERSGELRPGQSVVELTSGNTGTGLAVVCAVTGHPFIAVISRGNSPERARMMRALGAQVVLVDQADGASPGRVSGEDLQLVERAAERIARERGAFLVDQFNRRENALAHQEHTGRELIEQSGGRIDAFVDFAGTGGTFAGCARALRLHDPDIRCFVVEPDTAAYLSTGAAPAPNHLIQGGGYARALPLLDPRDVAGYIAVSGEKCVELCRALARTEGIFAGFSSGANLAAAVQLLGGALQGKTVALLINDTGLKYMSSDILA